MKLSHRWSHSLVLALSLASPALAQKSDLKRALPASTLFFVTMPDLDGSIERFKATPLAKMWAEQEVQAFFADLLKLADKEWQRGLVQLKKASEKGQSPLSVEEVTSLRVHGLTLAVTGVSLKVEEGQPMPDFGFMLHADFGKSAPAWKKAIEFGLAMAEQSSQGMLARNNGKIGDLATIELAPQMPGMKMSLNLAWIGDGIVFGTRPDEFKATVQALTGGKEVLTATPNYKETAKHLTTQGCEVEMYVQFGHVLDTALKLIQLGVDMNEDQMPTKIDVAGIGRALDALGLRGIQAVGMTSAYVSGKSVSRSYTLCPEPLRKGLLASASGQLATSFLKWVPKDATSFSAAKFDCMGIYEGIFGALKAYSPELAKQAEEHLAQIEKRLGFKFREDFFGSLGDEFIQWSMPMAAALQVPEMGFMLKMRDGEKFVKVVKSLVGLSDGRVELDQVERQGQKMQVLKINSDMPAGLGALTTQVVPTFSFKSGYMAFGLSASNVKRILDRMDREDDPKGDIRSNGEIGGLLKQLPKEGVSSVSVTDWKSSFEGMYQVLTTGLALIPMNSAEIPIDLSLLPESATLTKHLYGNVTWTVTDPQGFEGISQGPFGPEVMVAVGGAVGVAAGVIGATTTPRRMAAPPPVKAEKEETAEPTPKRRPAASDAGGGAPPPVKKDK